MNQFDDGMQEYYVDSMQEEKSCSRKSIKMSPEHFEKLSTANITFSWMS